MGNYNNFNVSYTQKITTVRIIRVLKKQKNKTLIVLIYLLLTCFYVFPQSLKKVETKYDNGKLREKYSVINDTLIQGEYNMWTEDGHKFLSGNYKNGIANGKWTQYYRNGKKRVEGFFSNGTADGIWRTYSPLGTNLSKTGLKNGFLDGEWAVWYIVVNAYHITFYCEANYDMGLPQDAEEWFLRKPVNIQSSLPKAKGQFKNGIPTGRWMFFTTTVKEQEVIFSKSKDENDYALEINWKPEDFTNESEVLGDISYDYYRFSLAQFVCADIPNFPSFETITYNVKGKVTYRIKYKEGEKVFETDSNRD